METILPSPLMGFILDPFDFHGLEGKVEPGLGDVDQQGQYGEQDQYGQNHLKTVPERQFEVLHGNGQYYPAAPRRC